jgi:hypothetical protein
MASSEKRTILRSTSELCGIALMWIGWLMLQDVLWIEKYYGFHHDYAMGIFAWLLVGGEDGFSLMPNPCGMAINLGLTVFATYAAGWTTRRLYFSEDRFAEGRPNKYPTPDEIPF